jgi:hypothetical protein
VKHSLIYVRVCVMMMAVCVRLPENVYFLQYHPKRMPPLVKCGKCGGVCVSSDSFNQSKSS